MDAAVPRRRGWSLSRRRGRWAARPSGPAAPVCKPA